MRPGVYASVMRDRKVGTRRVNTQPHQYSWKRFFIMIGMGALLFVPGLIVTIIGLESEEALENDPSDQVLYKFIGPAALAIGVCLLCGSGIYYCCWGFQSPVRRPHNKHKKPKKHGEHYDPLQAKSVPTISNNSTSAYTSVRKGSPKRKSPRGGGDKVYTSPLTPEGRRAERHSHSHGNHHNHHHHSAAIRTSSKNSLDTGSVRGHHLSNSRHRSSSHSNHSHGSSPHARINTTTIPDNQVTFINTNAPLAQTESGSVDISLDIEGGIDDTDKKY